jgi:protease I
LGTYVEQPEPSLEADVVITAAAAREFAALLILGGRAPEYLRNDASLLFLVREFEGPLPFRHRPWNPIADRGGPGARADRDVPSRMCASRWNVVAGVKPQTGGARWETGHGAELESPEFYREVFASLE